MKILRQLYIQVLISLLLAVILGLALPQVAMAMKPLGDIFIKLLRMMLAPIIFTSVVIGMSHVADMRQLGRLAFRSLLYFEAVTILAMFLGFVAVNLFQPGIGLHATGLALTDKVAEAASSAQQFTALGFFMGIVPDSLIGAFVHGEILQVLFVSLIFGVAINASGMGQQSALMKGISSFQDLLFRVLGFIMRLAPLGTFGAMSAAIGGFGAATLLYLGKLVMLYWLTSLFFVFVILGGIAALMRLPFFKILRLIRSELAIVFGTASGEVVLPRLLDKLERAGCDSAVVGFVLPAGYSFNLDGTSIYMAIAVGFIAQATDTPFSLADQAGVLGVLLLTSKGGTTVAGGAFVKLAATLQSVRSLPLGALGLLFGIDRLMSTCTALTNIVGNTLAVFVIARSEKLFDAEKLDACLNESVMEQADN